MMSRSSSLQPLKATVPFKLQKQAGAAVRHITAGDQTKADWQSQTQIYRTLSLDAIVGPYLQGQWPKESDGHCPSRHNQTDKSTQTSDTWLAGAEGTVGSHKRSASWGNSERLQDGSDVSSGSSFSKLKQQQQRQKTGLPVGNQEKLQSLHQSQPVFIPSASLTRLPSRLHRSEERLDQELEKVFIHHSPFHHSGLFEVPDGHRAPVPQLYFSSGSQINSSCVTSPSSSSPLCTSSSMSMDHSPQRPLDLDTVEEVNSSRLLLSSSPRPNKSYCFQREPPEGCERVRASEENISSCLDSVYHSTCPDPNKVNFTTHTGSAFCPVSLSKPLLPPVDLQSLFCSLTVSSGSCWAGPAGVVMTSYGENPMDYASITL